MQLGNFSVSLNVKDLTASQAFYEKLGFAQQLGQPEQGWLIMRNGECIIGLFQGMFEKNMLTFNPGWNRECETLGDYTDVRQLQKTLSDQGIAIESASEESSSGPAHFVVVDPDGNPILFDQHV